MEKKIKLQSGATLEMTMLSFKEGRNLFSVISKELMKVNMDLGDINISDITGSNMDSNFLNTFKNSILTLVTSELLEDALQNSFGRCIYNNKKIDEDTFEDIGARSDYFAVCWEIIRFNLTPFLPKIDLPFLKNLGAGLNILPQK